MKEQVGNSPQDNEITGYYLLEPIKSPVLTPKD